MVAKSIKLLKTTKSFFKLFLWSLLFPIFCVIILHLLNKLLPDYVQAYGELTTKSRLDISEITIWLVVLNSCIIAPVLEEIVFRGNLNYNNFYHYFALTVSFIFLILSHYMTNFINAEFLLTYSLISFGLSKLIKNYKFYIKFILVFSSLSFGLLHIKNINTVEILNSFSYIVYILPLIIFGYFLALIRLKHGLKLSILAHSLKNSIAILIIYI